MPVYDDNILPAYSSWTRVSATVQGVNLIGGTNGYATWQFKTSNFNAGNYALVSCSGCTGAWFFHVSYQDVESAKWYTETVSVPAGGLELPIILQDAKTDLLVFRIECRKSGTIKPIEFQLIEQAIRSVDIEFASGTSKVNPPETGWQTNAPEWQTGRYIWQRTATTFVDGHTEYSDPILIQNINTSAIYAIEEQFYLSTSNVAPTGGSWSAEQPSWSSKKYIWTRSKITWADGTITYSDNTLAKALNEANERAQEAIEAVEELDRDLSPDGVFNRLTDNGKRQGLYIDNGNYYFNATYIKAGILTVATSTGSTIFRADMSTKTVYLSGFTAANYSLFYGRTALRTNLTGTYIGTDGFSTGVKDGAYIYMANGELSGGGLGTSEGGYIDFNNYWEANGIYGCRIGGRGGIFLSTPRLGMAGYQHGGSAIFNMGQNKQVLIPDATMLFNTYWVHDLNRSYATNVVADLSMTLNESQGNKATWRPVTVLQDITWTASRIDYESIMFYNGLMVTA